VFAVDVLLRLAALPVAVRGLLDEMAHVATAIVLWPRSSEAPPPAGLGAGLAGAVLLDLDHLPRVMGARTWHHRPGRPATHSALAILALAWLLRLVWPAGWEMRRSVALGMALHLIRDMATGGVPLLWPLRGDAIHLPYGIYAAALLACEHRRAWIHGGREV
ncbi:MAG: metal-dependent hydrolase, partial [Chloroflexi bacterium]|nr:metal-dependent hydrolase [Chloroflexota bacterium]